jgi:hypothetical protein
MRAADFHDAHGPRRGPGLLFDFLEKSAGDVLVPQLFHPRHESLSFLRFGDLPEERKGFLGVFLVELGDGKSGVDNHPISDLDVFKERKIDPDFGPEVIHFSLLGTFEMGDLGRNS